MKLCERLLELSALLLSPLMLLPKFRAANAAADAQRALLGRKKNPKFIWNRITVTAKGFEERKLHDNECLRTVADAEGSAAAAALLLLNSKKNQKKSHLTFLPPAVHPPYNIYIYVTVFRFPAIELMLLN